MLGSMLWHRRYRGYAQEFISIEKSHTWLKSREAIKVLVKAIVKRVRFTFVSRQKHGKEGGTVKRLTDRERDKTREM